MAPTYKLTYFMCMGRGEAIRFLLAYGKIPYEDKRVASKDWDSVKPTLPFGKLPILEIDGKQVRESVSICRYLASIVGLAGATEWDQLQANVLVDTYTELVVSAYNAFEEPDKDRKEEKFKKLSEVDYPYVMSRLDKIVEENGGYFVNKQLTWADIYFGSTVQQLVYLLKFEDLSQYRHLQALEKKVKDIPQIKEYVQNRPDSEPDFANI